MNIPRPPLSESNSSSPEVYLSPEFKFVTDLAQTLLAEYGEEVDGDVDTARIEWRHPSGSFAIKLTTKIVWNEKLDIIGGEDIFEHVVFEHRHGTSAAVKTLITTYSTEVAGKIDLQLVEYTAGYIEENGPPRWIPMNNAVTTIPNDGDLATFEVALQVMRKEFTS